MEVRFQRGDDARWARPDWDDRAWQKTRPEGLYLPVHDGIYWVRFAIKQTDQSAPRPVARMFFWPRDEAGSPIDCVFMAGPFSYEFYWDGRMLHRSGIVGSSRDVEVPGPLDNFIIIPPDLMGPGEHVVALRVSTEHYNFHTPKSGFYFAMENYANRLAYEMRRPIPPLAGAAGAVLAAVFCGGLFWWVDRRPPLLVAAALSLTVAVFYLLIAWRWLHADTYDWFEPRLTAIVVTVTVICGLQAWLLLKQFAVPHRRWWLAALLPLMAVALFSSPYHSVIVLWLYRVLLFFSIVVTGWAAWRRRTGARWVLAGALVGLATVHPNWETREFVSPMFLLTFGAQIMCLLVALGLQLSGNRQKARQASLTAARLEIELLKKNLQPHFLLNTLAALSEVVEQNPQQAVALIDDLAAEFRTVARMSAEKLVPLAQELELCRGHLRVMSVRTGRICRLEALGVDETALVPPAVFLTLIENGFAHQRVRNGVAEFKLSVKRVEGGAVRYVFLSPGDVVGDSNRPVGGTGLRYVRARLEESFPARWSLHGERVAEGWRTTIEIVETERPAAQPALREL